MSVRQVLQDVLHLRPHYLRRRYTVEPEMNSNVEPSMPSPSPFSFPWNLRSIIPSSATPSSSSSSTSTTTTTPSASAGAPDSTAKVERPRGGAVALQRDGESGQLHRRKRRVAQMVYEPRLSAGSSVMPAGCSLKPVQSALPARFSRFDWQLIYSTMRHGVSLQTLYAKCSADDPVVLVLRDDSGAVFGCYVSTGWHVAKHYYGNGEMFVFKLVPTVAVYKWSRENSLFQLASSDSLAMGGGGNFALFLDSLLEHGSSRPCPTFNSPPLASNLQFAVVVLEAYKLVPSYKLITQQD